MRRRGVTLIELMVSMGVIGILMGVLLPAVASARESALEARSLANLHGLGLTIEAYTQVHKGEFPFFHRSEETRARGVWGPFEWSVNGEPPGRGNALATYQQDVFRAMASQWPTLLYDVAPWREHFETWISPGLRVGRGSVFMQGPGVISYRYCHSFIAKPRVWSASPASPADIAPIVTAAVAHPSAKVIFFDAVRAYLRVESADSPRPTLFVDGSASVRRDSKATTPVQNQLRRASPTPYNDTPMGVQGRDF